MGKKDEIEVNVSEVLDYKKVSGDYIPTLAEVVRRKFTADAARKAGIKATTQQLQKGVDYFRYINELTKASDTEAWMELNGVTIEILEDYIETSFLVSKFKDGLEKKANKSKYLSHPDVKDKIRDLIYKDWLAINLK